MKGKKGGKIVTDDEYLKKIHDRVEKRKAEERETIPYKVYSQVMDIICDKEMTIKEVEKVIDYLERTVQKNKTTVCEETAVLRTDVLEIC